MMNTIQLHIISNGLNHFIGIPAQPKPTNAVKLKTF